MDIPTISLWLGGLGILFSVCVSAVLGAIIWRVRDGSEWLLFALLPLAGNVLTPIFSALVLPFAGFDDGGFIVVQGGLTAMSLACLGAPLLVIWRGLKPRDA